MSSEYGEAGAMGDMQELIEYYREQGAPGDQQMVIALLREMQQEDGGVLSADAIRKVAGAYAMKETMLMALIRRVPGLLCEDAPHRLEICGTCKAGVKLRDFVERTYGVKSGAVSKAGFAYRVTPCMKNCKNGPSIRWDSVLHSRADETLIRSLIEGKR